MTLDGRPIPDAYVSFMPEDEEHSHAFGWTDHEGNYTLQQSTGEDGVAPGTYTVRITTYREGNPDADPPIKRVPERVPARYNVRTDLTRDIQPGDDVIDFPLTSGGPIIQPGRGR